LIERHRALGTRVIGHEINEDLGQLRSYTEEMKLLGLQVRTEVLMCGLHVPESNVQDKLHLRPNEQTLYLRRLRGTNEVFPIVILNSEIPASYAINPNDDFTGSLYQLIEEKYRFPIQWAEEQISVAKATVEEARLLRLKPTEGVLVMERVTYTRENRPLEFVRGVYHPKHYTFSIRLER
jgi:GntR family transcriptional regulator